MNGLGRTWCWIASPKHYIGLFLVLLLLAFPLVVTSSFYIQIMIMVLFFAYLSSCWNIISGYAGQLSIGQAVFLMVGAYTSSLLFSNLGLSPWIGMLIGGLLAVVLGLLIGYPTFRLRGAYFAIATIVWAEGLRKIVENTEYIGGLKIGGAEGLTIPLIHHSLANYQFVNKTYYYYIMLGLMLLIIYLTYRIDRSKLGYYLSAVREDEDAARALGVDVRKYKLMAMAISAFFTALAGTFYAQLLLYIEPVDIGGIALSIEMLLIGVIGGRGTIIGPIVGAFLLVPCKELVRTYTGTTYIGAHLVFYGAIMVAVILFFPQGLERPFRRCYLGLARWLGQTERAEDEGR